MDIIKPYKGIITDTPYDQQPEGTYTYALNTCIEIDKSGDLSACRGNIDTVAFPIGYHPIGNCYFNLLNYTECNLIFLGNNDIGDGEIGVFYNDGYLTLLSGFSLNYIVRAVY